MQGWAVGNLVGAFEVEILRASSSDALRMTRPIGRERGRGMACPICEKRKAGRFCPAKGEKICAVCCGTEREVTIDCPWDCGYLLAARRYEQDHPKPVPPEEVPFPDVEVRQDLIHEHRVTLSGLGATILIYAANVGRGNELVDRQAMAALTALAETYRTLGSGIYYEKPPDEPEARGLYGKLAEFVQKTQKLDAQEGRPWKDAQVLPLLVFLLRVARARTSGRPRSRAFLDFLRAQFPGSVEKEAEKSRIIVP